MNAWLGLLLIVGNCITACGNASSAHGTNGIGRGGSAGSEMTTAGTSGATGSETATVGSGGATGANGSGGSAVGLTAVPTNHRPQSMACPEERAPGLANVAGTCTQDSECSDGTNGRCISPNVVGPMGQSGCSYDYCLVDSDCAANAPCLCREAPTSSDPNYCLTESNCRIDSDCGPGGFCSPSLFYVDVTVHSVPVSGSGMAGFGYFCHTPRDLCVNDSDCDTTDCLPEQGCGWMACGYSSRGRWDCFEIGPH